MKIRNVVLVAVLLFQSALSVFAQDIVGDNVRAEVEQNVKKAVNYYTNSMYKEAFDLLRSVDQYISSKRLPGDVSAQYHYLCTKERMRMYMRLRKSNSAYDQLEIMAKQVKTSGSDSLMNDMLYNKVLYFYHFDKLKEGNEAFRVMADKLTGLKKYDMIDDVYQTLINNGRRSGNAHMVAQAYSSYLVWKDSVNALKVADEINALKHQIADNEADIAEKASSLSTRKAIIIGLCILVAILTAVLVMGALVLLRFIMLTRKQKKTIEMLKENNALKAKFISNISEQIEPTLRKLDKTSPHVKSLLDFTTHIQMLSELESTDNPIETEEIAVQPFCEELMEVIKEKVQSDVALTVNAPKMTAIINKEYVQHIIEHLLLNAADYTPAGGHIRLEFKKRGAHTFQFIITDTGCGIPEERREDVFKAFLQVRDLTTGDGLGLPICKQMALKMNGDLFVDPEYSKGTRFILDLKA